MTDGRYVYCIFEGKTDTIFNKIGILGNDVYTINHKEISAAVSPIPFKEFEPNIENISTHQRVIEETRKLGTAIPVRFGVLFKEEEGVKNLLKKSYSEFKTKIDKLKNKNEYGVKVFLEEENREKLKNKTDTTEIKKLKEEIASSSEGTAYFLKLKLEEIMKNEALKHIDVLAQKIHQEISEFTSDSCLLNDELDELILNSAYLISSDSDTEFTEKLENIKEKYKELKFHTSGPWAPYSFC